MSNRLFRLKLLKTFDPFPFSHQYFPIQSDVEFTKIPQVPDGFANHLWISPNPLDNFFGINGSRPANNFHNLPCEIIRHSEPPSLKKFSF